jgi:hypothetical protein
MSPIKLDHYSQHWLLLKNKSTMTELSKQFYINQNMIICSKKQLYDNSAEVFASKFIGEINDKQIQSSSTALSL